MDGSKPTVLTEADRLFADSRSASLSSLKAFFKDSSIPSLRDLQGTLLVLLGCMSSVHTNQNVGSSCK